MSADTTAVQGALARRPEGQVQEPPRIVKVQQWLESQRPAIASALGRKVDSEQFLAFAVTQIRQQPDLMDCTPDSLLGAFLICAQVNLEPGPFGYVFLNPRNRNIGDRQSPRWVKEVQFTIGWKGYVELARRSGVIKELYAHAVYEDDVFEYELGLHRTLKHVPAKGVERAADGSDVVAAYAVAHFTNGGTEFVVLDRAAIEKRRAASPGAFYKDGTPSKSSPWTTHYEQMARKSPLRDLSSFLPLSGEVLHTISLDESVQNGAVALAARAPEPFDHDEFRRQSEAAAAIAASSEPVEPGPVAAVDAPPAEPVPPAQGPGEAPAARPRARSSRAAAPTPEQPVIDVDPDTGEPLPADLQSRG